MSWNRVLETRAMKKSLPARGDKEVFLFARVYNMLAGIIFFVTVIKIGCSDCICTMIEEH